MLQRLRDIGEAGLGFPSFKCVAQSWQTVGLNINAQMLINRLLSDEETLKCNVGELDNEVWSQNDAVYPISSLRARFCFAVIRDEVFEIALAVGVKPSEEFLL